MNVWAVRRRSDIRRKLRWVEIIFKAKVHADFCLFGFCLLLKVEFFVERIRDFFSSSFQMLTLMHIRKKVFTRHTNFRC